MDHRQVIVPRVALQIESFDSYKQSIKRLYRNLEFITGFLIVIQSIK